MAISHKRYDKNNSPTYEIDERLSEKLKSSVRLILETKEQDLRKLADVKTLVYAYEKTREYSQQVDENGVLSLIINKMVDELSHELERYYIQSILQNIEIQTRIKNDQNDKTISDLRSNVHFNAIVRPYVEFIIEVNTKESYLVKFTFQLDTSIRITNVRLTNIVDNVKAIQIENIGIKIELSLFQSVFSDLLTSRLQISLEKKKKLGSNSFEIDKSPSR